MAEPLDAPIAPDAEPEPQPEGVIDVQGAKMVPLTALEAERKRARETTETRVRAELAPAIKDAEQAKQLQADIAALRPQLEYLQAHPELLKEQKTDQDDDIPDEKAERYARQYELYTASGLDLPRAKRIMRDNQAEIARVARTVAQETVEPLRQMSATQASRANFVWAASQKTDDGRPLVDHKALATMWASFPAELTAQPDVARVVLNAAIGEAVRSNTPAPHVAEYEPVHSEAPGGGPATSYRISDVERRVAKSQGIKESDWTSRAKTYRPGEFNVLGE